MSGPRRSPLAWAAALLFLAFFAAFFVWPILHATRSAFFPRGSPSLDAFLAIARSPALRGCFVRSGLVAIAATLLASLLAVPAAFLLARCAFPGRALLRALVLVPLVLPPFVGAIGLRRLFARFGSVNLVLMQLFGLDRPPVDWLASELVGVVLLQALHLYPIIYLNVYASLLAIDASLEEAGRNLGLGPLALVRRVILPLAAPGYFAGALLTFVWAFSDLGTPLLLGVRDLVAVQIFDRVNDLGEDPTGYALVLALVAVSVGAFLLSRLLAPGGRFTGATKGAARPGEHRLRGLAAVAAPAGLGLLVLAAFLPHAAVVVLSFAERWFLSPLPDSYTLAAYGQLVRHPLAAPSIQLSLSLAAASTLIDLGLGLLVAAGVARRAVPLAGLLDGLAMAPLGVPGIVLAFGLAGAYAGTPLDPVTRSPFVLLVASYAVRRLPFAARSFSIGLAGLDRSLEEAARNLGLGARQTLARVTLPLIAPHLIAGSLLCFVFAAVEVSDSMVLAVRPEHYPMTKAIWELMGRLDDGPFVASALGVLVMALLIGGFVLAGRALGRKGADIFRIGGGA